jgi:hypothetical protein
MQTPNVPNTNQQTVHAFMKTKSFISVKNPNESDVSNFDLEVNNFLETIDNKKRFLNGRNAYSVGERLYVLVWYLESIPDQPVTTPFGGSATPVTTVSPEEKKNEQDNSTKPA